MDLPVGVMEWEVFLPQQYRVSDFGGDAIAAELMPGAADPGPGRRRSGACRIHRRSGHRFGRRVG